MLFCPVLRFSAFYQVQLASLDETTAVAQLPGASFHCWLFKASAMDRRIFSSHPQDSRFARLGQGVGKTASTCNPA
jgi:hypothetical protein